MPLLCSPKKEKHLRSCKYTSQLQPYNLITYQKNIILIAWAIDVEIKLHHA